MSDVPHNPIPHKQIHPAYQFLILVGLLLLALIVGNVIGAVVIGVRYGLATFSNIAQGNLSAPHVTSALWILQFLGTTLPILLTPIFFAYFIVREPDDYLKTNIHFPWILMLIVFAVMLFSNPIIEFLGNLNQQMVLPKSLKGVEDWMRQSEDSTKKLSDMMLQMNNIWNMLFDLLFIGLLTAIVEETLFRGCLQTIFIRWMKNKHIAIWLTAILFSAFTWSFSDFYQDCF
jgi:membrane protease YdiL (CAAX protease family)